MHDSDFLLGHETATAEEQAPPSSAASDALGTLALFLALGVVYASMFYADLLVAQLDEERHAADERALLSFSWLMHKKTLVGIQRFEDAIHAKFEELVLLGFLKPRGQPD